MEEEGEGFIVKAPSDDGGGGSGVGPGSRALRLEGRRKEESSESSTSRPSHGSIFVRLSNSLLFRH